MNYKTVKSHADIKLSGKISVELIRKDGSFQAVEIRGEGPNEILRISKQEYGGLDVLVIAPPEMEKRWEVSGKIDGIAIEPVLFENEFEATNKKINASDGGNDLVVKEIEVPVKD